MVAGYECKCPDGIRGEQCEIDDDDCASGPCQNDGSCKDASGSFKYVFIFGKYFLIDMSVPVKFQIYCFVR